MWELRTSLLTEILRCKCHARSDRHIMMTCFLRPPTFVNGILIAGCFITTDGARTRKSSFRAALTWRSYVQITSHSPPSLTVCTSVQAVGLPLRCVLAVKHLVLHVMCFVDECSCSDDSPDDGTTAGEIRHICIIRHRYTSLVFRESYLGSTGW